MSDKHEWNKSVGGSFVDWSTRIYPGRLMVSNSTVYLRTLRSKMLTVINRIDDELKRRQRAQT